MEHKYTLKDILLEAGVREYRATEPDNVWQASEKHADAMEKLFEKHGPSSRPALLKWLAAAAASVLIIGILVFIKPVREAVSSLFTGSETDRITDTEPATEPGTDTAVPPDTEPDESTAPATDTESTDTETDEETTEVHTETLGERIEDALRTAVNSGVTPQVWAKLWDLDDAGAGYHLPGVTADDPTYDYLLKKYFAAGTADGEKAFISASLSVLLGERWEEKYGEYADQHSIPYPTKYISVEAYREGYNEGLSGHVNWLTNYRDGFISYAKYETESGCREKYPYSVKVLDAAGFHGYADQAKTDREKIVRSLSELFDLSLSVKYGAAVYDASSRTYYRRSETGAEPKYGPGDAIYKALLGYYPKSALEDAEHAPICTEQALNIKYADGWLAYFSSMSSDAIANNTAKQSEYFVITEDGLVLTVAKYGAADPETVLPAIDTAGATVTGTDKTGVYSVVFRITAPDGQAKEYNAVFDCTDGPARLVSGTFVTDWLYSVPGASAPETTEPETTAPETTAPETTVPETTAPVQDDIENYLKFEIVDPSEDESNLTVSMFGSGKFARLIGIDPCSFSSIEIPAEYNGYPVKSVSGWYDWKLFMNVKGLKYVEFPDSVIYIEHTLHMFRGNTTLTEVRLPKYLKEIPEAIFYGCENLQKVILPETVERICSEAFYGCKKLRIEKIPGTVKTIGAAAFSECLMITEITLPQGLESLGSQAFQYCFNLKKITLPDTLQLIDSECFWRTGLISVVIPANKDWDGLPQLGSSLFVGCTAIESVQLPEGLSEITWQMFSECSNLKELNIPESVTTVQNSAFANCGAETIRLGKNVEFIEGLAFDQFNGKIEIDPENPYYRIENGEIVRIEEN